MERRVHPIVLDIILIRVHTKGLKVIKKEWDNSLEELRTISAPASAAKTLKFTDPDPHAYQRPYVPMSH